MDTLDPNYLHPLCPYCAKANGSVRAVTVGGPDKTLTYRCPACERGWKAVHPDDEAQRPPFTEDEMRIVGV